MNKTPSTRANFCPRDTRNDAKGEKTGYQNTSLRRVALPIRVIRGCRGGRSSIHEIGCLPSCSLWEGGNPRLNSSGAPFIFCNGRQNFPEGMSERPEMYAAGTDASYITLGRFVPVNSMVQIIPAGAARTINADQPANCPMFTCPSPTSCPQ